MGTAAALDQGNTARVLLSQNTTAATSGEQHHWKLSEELAHHRPTDAALWAYQWYCVKPCAMRCASFVGNCASTQSAFMPVQLGSAQLVQAHAEPAWLLCEPLHLNYCRQNVFASQN